MVQGFEEILICTINSRIDGDSCEVPSRCTDVGGSPVEPVHNSVCLEIRKQFGSKDGNFNK